MSALVEPTKARRSARSAKPRGGDSAIAGPGEAAKRTRARKSKSAAPEANAAAATEANEAAAAVLEAFAPASAEAELAGKPPTAGPPKPRASRPASKAWDGTAPLVCVGVSDVAPRVRSFRLAPQDGSRVRFHAGQAITLDWTMPGGTNCRRTFTIASPPTERNHIEVTVKALGEGSATADMHARLTEGMALTAFGPGGRFGLAYNPAKKALLIGAGSGSTPMMSMLRLARDRRHDTDITYVHCASTPADVLFADDLAAITAACPNIAVTVIVSRVPEGQAWLGPRGRLTRRLLHALVPDARERETFLCGPEGFMEAMRRVLRAEGLDPGRLHEENFLARAPAPPALTEVPAQGWSIALARSSRKVPIEPDRTVYENLRHAGVVLPTGCRSGICGTCKVRLVQGEVAMVHNGGLSERDEAAGHVLACCSYARSDLVIEA